MGNVIEFRRAKSDQEDTLRETMARQQRGDLKGLIQIEATSEGEDISIMGAFADHMQYGALALIKTLGILADKITDSGQIGHSSSHSMQEFMPRKKRRGLAPRFLETTDLAPLELMPKRKAR
jgi:hypothetical protein